jgi:hypothetical protein
MSGTLLARITGRDDRFAISDRPYFTACVHGRNSRIRRSKLCLIRQIGDDLPAVFRYEQQALARV